MLKIVDSKLTIQYIKYGNSYIDGARLLMSLSFREKSIVGSLVAMLSIYGYYFATLTGVATRRYFDAASLIRLIGAVVLIVAIEVVYHIVIAVSSRVELKDERDVLIESRAYRVAYFVLATGVGLLITAAIFANLVNDLPTTPYSTANLLLFFMVIAEAGKFLTQLVYYRKGI